MRCFRCFIKKAARPLFSWQRLVNTSRRLCGAEGPRSATAWPRALECGSAQTRSLSVCLGENPSYSFTLEALHYFKNTNPKSFEATIPTNQDFRRHVWVQVFISGTCMNVGPRPVRSTLLKSPRYKRHTQQTSARVGPTWCWLDFPQSLVERITAVGCCGPESSPLALLVQ